MKTNKKGDHFKTYLRILHETKWAEKQSKAASFLSLNVPAEILLLVVSRKNAFNFCEDIFMKKTDFAEYTFAAVENHSRFNKSAACI